MQPCSSGYCSELRGHKGRTRPVEFVITVVAIDVVVTIVCALKGRSVFAVFGVGAISTAIFAFNAGPLGGGIFLFVSLPLSLIVIIGAFRHAIAGSRWATKQLVAEASKHLDVDEQILIAVDATPKTDGALAGVLIATNKRLLFYAKKEWFGFKLESFPYKTISSFEPDKMGGTLGFRSSGNIVLITSIRAQRLDKFVATVKTKIDKAHSSEQG